VLRRAKVRREPLSPALRHWLETGGRGDPEADGFLEMFSLTHRNKRAALAAWWRAVREETLAEWIAEFPGSRPFAWWALGDAPEPQRRRLGGVGTPKHEGLAYAPAYRFGIPVYWVNAWEEAYYNGRRRDIHGHPIGTQYTEGHFAGRAIDPEDPPRYEAQAAYLARLGLLSPAERMALPTDALEDEVVLPATDDQVDTP
jgi:hypothetical protein